MSLRGGDIIHAFIEGIYPPKNKYLLCVHPEEKLFLMVNTENREMYRCITIKSSDYSFLNGRDRFISSNKFFKVENIDSKKCKILGSLNKKDRLRIYDKIQTAPKISKFEKSLSGILQ